MFTLVREKQIAAFVLFLSFSLIGLSYLFYEPLSQLYTSENYVFIHAILEIFSVTVCACICMYGWKAYEDTTILSFLWLPHLFFAIGTLDLLHLMNYPGMPPFFTESSVEKTTWFWIVARLTAAIGLYFILYFNTHSAKNTRFRLNLYTAIYLIIMIIGIYLFEKELPILVDSFGPTWLKNTLEYIVCFFIGLSLAQTYQRFKKWGHQKEIELLTALSLILLSELTLTLYSDISDIFHVSGHLIKAFGYLYILKAYFWTSLHLTFYEKRQAEKGLRETQDLLQSFYHHTPDSVVMLETTGRVLAANEGFVKVYGWKEEEVKGRPLRELMPDVAENIDQVVEAVSSGKELIGYETFRQTKEGKKILINMTISPIRDEHGDIVRLAVISRDMTAQREAERRLLEAENEFKEIVKLQQGAIFKIKRLDQEFVFTFCEGQLLYELGRQPEDVVGQLLGSFIEEFKFHEVFKQFERAWNGSECTYEGAFEGRVLIVTLKPIIRDGEVFEVIGSCMDITQLKRTEELLQKSEKLAVVGELAAGLAHEIRNPLTTLKGFTQLINPLVDSENKGYIELMLSELNRIEFITNEFMAVAKPQAISFYQQDGLELLKHVVQFYNPQALLKGVQMVELYEVENAPLYCEGNQIKQVFINIVKNAMEAMPDGGTLTVSVKEHGGQLVVRISDSGVGISEEILPKLGEPFYTLKEKGTGLGLMVSFRIIESHRGSIAFESEEGKGTTVEIRLPLIM